MLLRKYNLVIFKDGHGGSHNLSLHGWLILLGFLLVCGIIACNIWLWRHYLDAKSLKTELLDARSIIAEQRRSTLHLAERINSLSHDLDRVKKFDSRLRLMMNMDKDPADVGDEVREFARNYLPVHRHELAARKMQDFLDQLSETAKLEEVNQQDILRALRDKRSTLSALPSIWPVTGFITSSFGSRLSPFGRGIQFHKGLDISNRIGTPIIAPADGAVILASPDGGYGNSVEVDHGGGIITKYAHMQRFNVKPGDWVKRGQTLGYIGLTGRTTGPHLHYEVRLNGVPVNPMNYILE